MTAPSDTIRAHLPMFVLDVLRYADSFDSIRNVINDHHTVGWRDVWGRAFDPSEIDIAIAELTQRGFVTERTDYPNYYEITSAGRTAWNNWIPPGVAGERVTVSRLLRQWDPIGVFALNIDGPEDEYEGYVSPIISSLKSGADENSMKRQLEQIRVEYIGLPPDPVADAETACELCRAWSNLETT